MTRVISTASFNALWQKFPSGRHPTAKHISFSLKLHISDFLDVSTDAGFQELVDFHAEPLAIQENHANERTALMLHGEKEERRVRISHSDVHQHTDFSGNHVPRLRLDIHPQGRPASEPLGLELRVIAEVHASGQNLPKTNEDRANVRRRRHNQRVPYQHAVPVTKLEDQQQQNAS